MFAVLEIRLGMRVPPEATEGEPEPVGWIAVYSTRPEAVQAAGGDESLVVELEPRPEDETVPTGGGPA